MVMCDAMKRIIDVCRGAARRAPAIVFVLLALPGYFQDEPADAPPENILTYGQVITGELDNTLPQEVYSFEALRCDFLSVRLSIIGGDLDPMVTILDDTGTAIFSRDDSLGTIGVNYEPLAIPRSGRYLLVVGRFGYGLGSTAGRYELIVERIGNGSAYGCALRYGDTVFNNINSSTPQIFYSFRANQGDIVNIRMEGRSGDLDPFLQITDAAGFVMQTNDDVLGSGTDAEIEALFIPQGGTYYIIATRYGQAAGTSSGNFVLTISEAEGSGLGNSAQAAVSLRIGSTVTGTLTDTQYERYYRFEARQNDLLTISMTRTGTTLDSYLVLTNANLQEIAFNDDSNETQNSLIENFIVPQDGTYFIIATRFERENGTTTGDYTLQLQNQGNAFDGVPADVPRISYGSTITGSLDDVVRVGTYAFYAVEGDVITIAMNRGDGDLDPVLRLLAADGETVLATDDDSGGGQNARIDRYEITETGIYYISASRYTGNDNPNTSGSYVIVLARRLDE